MQPGVIACDLQPGPDGYHVCTVCGNRRRSDRMKPGQFLRCGVSRKERPLPKPRRPQPGTELKRLLVDLGIEMSKMCGCENRQNQMDTHGPEWCLDHIGEITGWLAEKRKDTTLPTWRIAANALRSGVWLNPFDPLSSLVREAVRRSLRRPG